MSETNFSPDLLASFLHTTVACLKRSGDLKVQWPLSMIRSFILAEFPLCICYGYIFYISLSLYLCRIEVACNHKPLVVAVVVAKIMNFCPWCPHCYHLASICSQKKDKDNKYQIFTFAPSIETIETIETNCSFCLPKPPAPCLPPELMMMYKKCELTKAWWNGGQIHNATFCVYLILDINVTQVGKEKRELLTKVNEISPTLTFRWNNSWVPLSPWKMIFWKDYFARQDDLKLSCWPVLLSKIQCYFG